MSETTSESATWEFDGIAAKFARSLGSIFEIRGTDSSILEDRIGVMRRALERCNLRLLCLDPTGGLDTTGRPNGAGSVGEAGDVRMVTAEYARLMRRGARGERRVDRLLDVVTGVRGRPSENASRGGVDEKLHEAVAELWAELAQREPAVLLVLHPEELAADGRQLLGHLVRAHFVDEVGALIPELEGGDTIDASIAFASRPSLPGVNFEEVKTEIIDLADEARRAIREQLSEGEVVDRFVASTGGDPERLARLVDSLPDNCENFWRFRYRALEDEARELVDILAVAGCALPVVCLRRCLFHWRGRRLDEGRVRDLCSEGYFRREFDGGTMRLELADAGLRRGLIASMDEQLRLELHAAVAELANEGEASLLDDGFFARHCLKAGYLEEGFRYGLRAAKKFHARHALHDARELFEQLFEHAVESKAVSESVENEIRSYLVDILGDLGEVEAAIRHAEELVRRHDVDDPFRWRMELERARLHTRVGEVEAAQRIFENVRERFDSDDQPGYWGAAVEGLADLYYTKGDQERAEVLAEEVVESIGSEGAAENRRAMRSVLDARNLLGRIALYRTECDRARRLFESNRVVAGDWGWEREGTRAELNLALIEMNAGRFASAADTIEELLDRNPPPTIERRAYLQVNLGMAYHRMGRYGDSLEAYREGFRAARRAGDELNTGMAAYNLATLCHDFGAYDRVVDLVEWLEGREFDEGHRFAGALPGLLRVNALVAKEEYAEALAASESLPLEGTTPSDRLPAAKLELRMAFAHVQLGQSEQAIAILDSDADSERSSADECLEGWRELGRAALAREEGDWSRAAERAASAEQALRNDGNFHDGMRAALIRIRALVELDRSDEAEALVEKRLVEFRDRTETIPEEFRSSFCSIPVYRRLVELARTGTGTIPEGLRAPERGLEVPSADGEGAPAVDVSEDYKLRQQFPNIVGRNEQLVEVLTRIDRVADSDAPVLIQGESGSGKELVARAVHRRSGGGEEAPFVKVNCGAFVDNLLLSELFGHEKGAFTGAVERRAGCFARADGGTIFLDEIGEVSPKAQVALLRVLQEGEFERVGGNETHTVDARVVCATNRDLESMVETGSFRLDLYYRLKGVVLEMPPLRERRDDIPMLVRHFARGAASGTPPDFDRKVMEFLVAYRWPGNVRELRHFVESVLLFVDDGCVEMRHLREFRDFFPDREIDVQPPQLDESSMQAYPSEPDGIAPRRRMEAPEEALVERVVDGEEDLKGLQKEIQRVAIERALERTGGNITRAAEILEMSRPRLSQIVNEDDGLLELKERLVA